MQACRPARLAYEVGENKADWSLVAQPRSTSAGHAGIRIGNYLLAGHCWHSFHAHVHVSPQQTAGTRLKPTGPVYNAH